MKLTTGIFLAVAGIGTAIGGEQAGWFDFMKPVCDMDGDGRVYRQISDTEIARAGILGNGISLSRDGGEFVFSADQSTCLQQDLVTASGKPVAGFDLRQ